MIEIISAIIYSLHPIDRFIFLIHFSDHPIVFGHHPIVRIISAIVFSNHPIGFSRQPIVFLFQPIPFGYHPIVKIISMVSGLLWERFPSGVIFEGLDGASFGNGRDVVVIIVCRKLVPLSTNPLEFMIQYFIER